MKSRVAEVLLVILHLMWSADPTLEEPVTNLWYFKPRPSDACPAGVIDEQCLVFSQMLQNVTILEQVFTSNVGLIFLSGDHIIKLPNEGYLTYRDVENVTILGTPERRTTQIGIPGPASKIVCQLPFTFIFANITRLAFHNVTISGCGATVNSATLTETFFVQTRGIHTFGVGQRMALLLVNIRNFTMTRCLVENNLGYGLLGVNILGVSQVLGSFFVLNNNYTVGRVQCTRPPSSRDDITACSGGNALFVYEDLLECPTSPLQYVLIIRSSLFAFGVSGFGGRLNDYFLTRGGTGIGIILAQSSYGVTVELDTVSSFGNAALVGANIYVALYDIVDNSSVLIQNTRSMDANGCLNTLVAESGSASAGLHVDYGLPFVTPTTLRPICPTDRKFFQEEIVSIVNSRFSGNTALLGSGAYFEVRVGVGGAPDHGDSIIRFRLDRCVFLNNVGISGIALYYSQQNGLGAGNSELVLNNVQFINNSYIEPIRNLTELYTSYQLNVLQFISARNVTIQDCVVSSSEASALSAFGSNIVMRGQLLFDGNSGINGGALDLQDSRIGLLPNTRVTFTNNYASRYGGAMHITGRSDVLLPCFFQVHDPSFLPDPNITLYFKNNYAEDAGSVLYGGTVDRCLVSADSAFQANTSSEVFNYLADIRSHSSATSVISSDPFRVCFCFNGAPDCNRTFINITKFPGATVEIPVVNTGQRLGTTPSSVFVIPSKSAKIRNDQQVQQVQKVCTNINLTLTSTQLNTATVDLQTNLLAITSKVTINMQLLECPLGFILSNKTGACECDPISQSQIFNISCDIDQQIISRVAGCWINASYLGPNGTYNGIFVLGSCPYDYCLRQASYINLVDPDMQCNFNRTGVLCGACKDGLSLTLATSKCTACSNAGIALFLGYVVAAFGLLYVLFALDMTISSGTLSGLIFYGNIIHIHQSVYFPPGSYNIITVFIAWLNLDSGLDFCLYDGLDAYARIWLGFVFPFYIWILVIIIIVASRYSSKLARITGLKPVSVIVQQTSQRIHQCRIHQCHILCVNPRAGWKI